MMTKDQKERESNFLSRLVADGLMSVSDKIKRMREMDEENYDGITV